MIREKKRQTNTIQYRNMNWTIYLAALLLTGVMTAFYKSWDKSGISETALFAAAVTGVVCQVAANALKQNWKQSWMIVAAPFVIGILYYGSDLIHGVSAYASSLIVRWNALYDTGLPVYDSIVSERAVTAFGVTAACAAGAVVWALLYRRRLWISAILAGGCILFQVIFQNADRFSIGLLFLAIVGVNMVGRSFVMTKLSGIWAVWAAVLFAIMITQLPVKEIKAITDMRASVKEWAHEMRYGKATLPYGDLHQTGKLLSSDKTMLTVTSDERKDLYLKGYTAGHYDAGTGQWSMMKNSDYAGADYGMFDWLKSQNFDPFTQSASYYTFCDSADQPVDNYLTIKIGQAQRDQLYTPQSLVTLYDTQAEAVEEQKDTRIRTKGVTGIYEYSMEELSDTKPSELLVAKEWLEDPVTPEQKQYCEAESVYRKFVYEHYLTIDSDTKELIEHLFWNGYTIGNDGIYSAVSRIRDVLSKSMKYDATASEIPEGEDPVAAFLTEKKSGNSMLFASVGVLALRAHGIPARYVEGFYIPEERFTDNGTFSADLTGKDQHAWVEVYFDGVGFLPVDVTPGFYYDTASLKKMVEQPGTENKKAAITNDRQSQQDGTDSGQDTEDQEEIQVQTEDYRLLFLGMLALLFVIITVLFAVVELSAIAVPVLTERHYRKLDGERRVKEMVVWIYHMLALLGIEASPGYRTAETGKVVAEKIEGMEPGEYEKVCALIEKSIYGDGALLAFEERTIRCFTKKLEQALEALPKRKRLMARYQCIRFCMR